MCIKCLSNWTAYGQSCNSLGSCFSNHFPSWLSGLSFFLYAFATLLKLTHLASRSLDERLITPWFGSVFQFWKCKSKLLFTIQVKWSLLVINVQELKRKRRRQHSTGGTYLDDLFLWLLASWGRLSFSKLTVQCPEAEWVTPDPKGQRKVYWSGAAILLILLHPQWLQRLPSERQSGTWANEAHLCLVASFFFFFF